MSKVQYSISKGLKMFFYGLFKQYMTGYSFKKALTALGTGALVSFNIGFLLQFTNIENWF